MAVQADGRVLLGGRTWNGRNYDFALVRYNADGTLDTGFGNAGKAVTPIGSGGDFGYSVAVQPDGKILLGGSSDRRSGPADFALVRLNADGSLDTSFGLVDTLGGTVAYTENASPVVLDADVALTDADLSAIGSYAGAALTLARLGGANGEDRFSAKAGGSLSALTEGAVLTDAGDAIGAVTRNSGGTLQLTFTGGNAAQVSAVLRQIAYANASDAPPASVVLDWSVSDGNSGAQGTGGAKTTTGQSIVQITAVNDAPVVTTSFGSVTGGVQAAAVDGGLTLSDIDNATLAKATVSITSGFAAGQDVLAFRNTDATAFGNIAGSYDAATGVLTMTSSGSSATVAQFQAALRAVTYKNTATSPTIGTRTLSMVADDGTNPSLAATRTVEVAAVNQAPVVTTSVGTTPAPEQTTVMVDAGISLSDADSTTLRSATMSITGGFEVDTDNLFFDNTDSAKFGNIFPTYDWDTGVLTLDSWDSSATVAQFQAALRAVTYTAYSDAPSTATRTISVAVEDSAGATSLLATRDVSVAGINDAPTGTIGTGKVVIPVGPSDDDGQAVAIQADGKILLGGYSDTGNQQIFALTRVNPDGSLDTSFGLGGKVTTALGTRRDRVASVAVQADGRIVLAGFSDDNRGGQQAALVRYNADGSLDAGFGTGGKAVTAFASPGGRALSLLVLADGSLLVGGSKNDGTGYRGSDFMVARFTRTGALDAAFGIGGYVRTRVTPTDDTGTSLAMQADGKVVLVGTTYNYQNSDIVVVRYNADGSLDTGFGTGGQVITTFGGMTNNANSVVIQPDGKILLGGSTATGASGVDFALVRYNPDGSLDTGFGTGGKVQTPVGKYIDDGQSLALQADGKILLGGIVGTAEGRDFGLVRYNPDGTLDRTFGIDGKVTSQLGPDSDSGYSLKIQADGKIVLGGLSSKRLGSRLRAGALQQRRQPRHHVRGHDAVHHRRRPGRARHRHRAGRRRAVGRKQLCRRPPHPGPGGRRQRPGSLRRLGTLGSLVEGDALTLAGTVIGTVTHNSGGTLTLTLGAGATKARLNAALRQITYAATTDAPSASVLLTWTFGDGNTGQQGSGGERFLTRQTKIDVLKGGPTPFDDVLAGTPGDDTVSLLAGNDVYEAGAGNDLVSGNEGDDSLTGNEGNDTLYGNEGNDTLSGNQGDDLIRGGKGDDLIRGGQGNDLLFGDIGNDLLSGDLGNDTLTGGVGRRPVHVRGRFGRRRDPGLQRRRGRLARPAGPDLRARCRPGRLDAAHPVGGRHGRAARPAAERVHRRPDGLRRRARGHAG